MTTASTTVTDRRVALSEFQKWLWHFESRGVHVPEHGVQLCLQVEGPLNVARLQSSLNAVIARHDLLRARVEVVNELPFQRASAEATLALPIVDVSQRPEDDRESDARKRMRIWAREPFDLCADVLIRARLIRLGPERHWLHVVAHRFICDDESMGVLAGELAATYGAQEKLPPASALTETNADKNGHRADYWKDRVRAALTETSSDSAAERSLTREVETGPLSAFCRDHQTSMAQLTMAAFAILLQRYMGEAEVSLSIQPASSEKPESISDALPLSLAVEDSATAQEILQLTQAECATALSNAPVPFDVLTETLDQKAMPVSLTDTLFVFNAQPLLDVTVDGVRFQSLEEQPSFSRFKLEWHVRQEKDLLRIQAIYRKEFWEADVIERMVANYGDVLASMVANIDRRVEDLLPKISRDLDVPEATEQERDSSRDLIERELAEVWAELLGVSEVGINENFFALGGDSILSVLMVAKCRQRGLQITPRQIFQHKTIASLATVAVRETPLSTSSTQSSGVDGVNLTPIQQWFFEQPQRTASRFNQTAVLEGRRGLNAATVVKAVAAVQSHHESLRLRFSRDGEQWRQFVGDPNSIGDCVCVDLSDVPAERRADEVRLLMDQLQSDIDVEKGTLIRTAWIDFGPDEAGQLLVIIHHLAVDGVSWRILLEDLERAYTMAARNETIELTPVVTTYQQWAMALNERARSSAVQSELNYWLDVLRTAVTIPNDFNDGLNTENSARKISVTFDPEVTATLLQGRAEVSEAWIQQALLASLGQVLSKWTGRTATRIDVEAHGRQDIATGIDVSRTTGWFTSIYPLRLGATLTQIRERLKAVPEQGIGYGLLRFLSIDADVREMLKDAESAAICFNYLGQFDHLWSGDGIFRPLETLTLRHRDDLRAYVLQLDASIVGGELRVDWEYSENLHRPETIQRLADSFKHHLLELANAEEDPTLQFALVALDQHQLEQVLAELDPE